MWVTSVKNGFRCFLNGVCYVSCRVYWKSGIGRRRKRFVMVKRRERASGDANSGNGRLFDEDFYAEWPGLWEFLTEPSYDDGGKRALGTVSVFKDGEVLKACLSDRDRAEMAFVSAVSFKGLLDAMEQALSSSHTEWKEQKQRKK